MVPLRESGDDRKGSLTEEQYRILRDKGTEIPFTGKYVDHKESGMYRCAGCGALLFSSDTKFDTKAPGLMGWPSFADAIPGSVKFVSDDSEGMHRTAVVCKRCGGHLGHVFDDKSETTTGKHYCINSVCLEFEKEK
ncbi:MAG TPA: peptide-methionine (R)-S-oxide reductase MsrB [Candidatus Paceibacterota bacterium]|nr:peptide-methionine (R)-S-oxide reductase MsrB [Candidatus Paceibacterota bacterium]